MKLIISDLKKTRGELEINIPHLSFEHGKIHGLFGGNGCGKSSLAKIWINALDVDSGSIDYQGIQTDEISLMPQRPYLLQRTVYENIVYPLEIRKVPILEEKIDAWLMRADLLRKKHQYARTLSSGEQQKISFIRGLIFSPKLVIVDETLSNLDGESLGVFVDWIVAWQKENKATWLIISHQMNELRDICDKVHYMKRGQIIASGSFEDVLAIINNSGSH